MHANHRLLQSFWPENVAFWFGLHAFRCLSRFIREIMLDMCNRCCYSCIETKQSFLISLERKTIKIMDFRRLSDNNLSDFAANVTTLLGGTSLPSIDTNVRTDLVTAIGTKPADLATQTAGASVAETARKASVSTKNTTKFQIVALMSQVRDALRAGVLPQEGIRPLRLRLPDDSFGYIHRTGPDRSFGIWLFEWRKQNCVLGK
jgi:hypothetical protein